MTTTQFHSNMHEYGIEVIEREIKKRLISELTRTRLLFRLFSRIKSLESITEKLTRKSYSRDGDLMQDLIGFRITTYFYDDLKIIMDFCSKVFEQVELVYDEPATDVFRPLRKNMICKFPLEQRKYFAEVKEENESLELIDDTFEIQFRTTLSEGWHEVDHLMRYKCSPDWLHLTNESRMLNGIYASLETNDQALKALFEDIAYHHYKSKKWEAMLRNKLRLSFIPQDLSREISDYFNQNPEVGRRLFKLNRVKILEKFMYSKIHLLVTFDNWIFFINYCFLKDSFLDSITPSVLKNELGEAFNGAESPV